MTVCVSMQTGSSSAQYSRGEDSATKSADKNGKKESTVPAAKKGRHTEVDDQISFVSTKMPTIPTMIF